MAEKGRKYSLTVLRHGESEWNHDNRFCGWMDVGLTDNGLVQAQKAVEALVEEKFGFDVIYTSVLKRAKETAEIIRNGLEKAGVVSNLEIIEDWRLNERHYGSLTGHNKAEMAEKYGKDQVKIWRRSYDTRPPPISENHPFYNKIRTLIKGKKKSLGFVKIMISQAIFYCNFDVLRLSNIWSFKVFNILFDF